MFSVGLKLLMRATTACPPLFSRNWAGTVQYAAIATNGMIGRQ